MKFFLDESLGAALYKSNVLLRNKLQKELKTFEITIEQWSILKALYQQNEIDQEKMFNQKELAQKCCKDKASLTRILDILEKKDLVKRENSSKDRREFLIFISTKGKNLVENIIPVVQGDAERVMSIYTEEERLMLEDLLNKLITGLE
jgi:MarR family transcriptional regulator for hemolysin